MSTVAIVVPIGPDFRFLSEQLDALATQEGLAGRPIELLLSCNGSDLETVRCLAGDVSWPSAWTIRAIDSSARRGRSPARNIGWAACDADLVLFCDADDVAAPGWAAGIVAALESGADVVGTTLEYARLNATGLNEWGQINVHRLPTKFHHLPFASSCSLGVRRDVLEQTGGFDEHLERSEDVDFSWRAAYLGYRAKFVPESVLHFRRRETPRELFLQGCEDARSDAALLARHRLNGASWGVSDLLREVAGVCLALPQALARRSLTGALATRAGRLWGHITDLSRLALASRATQRRHH
ncbi:glycosyltransferase family 2 protein [Leucobacter aridicollis]|uniref:glycosyltransferase family 2 protein n=1 Tax=Leucobacter aridicollis TaxID=283878 RepID=UPI001F3C8CF0|nr:glycosyltransferase [Leucobacter aridicollis]